MNKTRHQVLFVGAINLDETVRLSGPVQPAASNPARWSHSIGGVATNACRAAAAVDVETLDIALIAPLASDLTGQRIREFTDHSPMRCVFIEIRDANSGRYTSVQDISGDLALGLAETGIAERVTAADIAPYINPGNSTLVFDANLSADTIRQLLSSSLTSRSIALAVSPAKSSRLIDVANEIDLIFLNRLEVAVLTGQSAQGHLNEHAQGMFALGFRRFVITDGAGPLHVGWEGSINKVVPEPLNTSTRGVNGLGDAFAGATIASLLHSIGADEGSLPDLLASIGSHGFPACRRLANSPQPAPH